MIKTNKQKSFGKREKEAFDRYFPYYSNSILTRKQIVRRRYRERDRT
jgi:hypothetical protein